jgi:hypothetical protein
MKTNTALRGWKLLNLKRRAHKESESSIELVAHTQMLIQQKQLDGRNHHKPLKIFLLLLSFWVGIPYRIKKGS